jgi:hypothetical protein
MTLSILSFLSGPISQILTPILVVFLGKVILNVHEKIDALPATAKQGVVVVVAGLLTSLQSFLGAPICSGNPCDLDSLALPTLASSAVAFILHALTKKK